MKNKQFICDIIQLIFIFISGILVFTFILEDIINNNIVLGVIYFITMIPVIIFSHLNIRRYNSILDIISYIAHPIKEDFLYKKNWSDVQLTILIISYIYLFISLTSLILFILIKIKKYDGTFSCQFCDYYLNCDLDSIIIKKQEKIINEFFDFKDLDLIFFGYNDFIKITTDNSNDCTSNSDKINQQKKFIKLMIKTIKELKTFYTNLE